MTQTLIIAAREVRERTFVLPVAAFVAIFPFVLSTLATDERSINLEMIGVIGSMVAATFTLALAVILGASIVGRELTERRLSFYFSRPVDAGAIWFGKLMGGVVLIAVSFALIFLPSLVAGHRLWARSIDFTPGAVVGLTFGAALLAFLLSHAISTTIRARSAYAAVGLVAAPLTVAAGWMIHSSLVEVMAAELAKTVAIGLIGGLALALVGAGAWQLSRGRADARRSLIEMSKFLWIAVAVVLAVAAAYTTWVFSVDPEDLDEVHALQSGPGDRAVIAGTSPFRGDYYAVFLANLTDQKAVTIPAVRWSEPEFSRSGDAAYTRASPPWRRGGIPFEVLVHRFGKDERPIRTGITALGRTVLSDDLGRLAVVGRDTVSIHEIDSQRLLASAAMPKDLSGSRMGFFVTPDRLRVITTDPFPGPGTRPFTVRIYEFDVRGRQFVETGSWSTTARALAIRVSPDGSKLLANRIGEVEGPRILVLDGRTARVTAALPVTPGGYWSAQFLSGDRVAVISAGPDRTLHLFDANGARLHDIPLGRFSRTRGDLRELASGQVVAALRPSDSWEGASGRGWEAVVVDLRSGKVSRREREILPVFDLWSSDPRRPAPNKSGEILVLDSEGRIGRWNPLTGVKKKLL